MSPKRSPELDEATRDALASAHRWSVETVRHLIHAEDRTAGLERSWIVLAAHAAQMSARFARMARPDLFPPPQAEKESV